MKVFVAGAAGFIGSNICEALVDRGHEIVGLDNFALGRRSNLSRVIDKMDLVRGSIKNEKLVTKLTKDADVICNQAAASSAPMFSLGSLRESVSTNVDGFLVLLKAAAKNNVKRIVYASTSSMYGNLRPPLREDMKVTPPNLYSATKIMNEHSAMLFSQLHGLETVGFRYMAVYGPHERSKGIYANLASQFLWAMKKGQRPVIYGDGRQTRDFVYVKDVARANLMAIESKKKLEGKVFNVGTGKCYSLNQLVAILNEILDTNFRPKHTRMLLKNYIKTQLSDASKIRRELGWKPRFSLEEGIEDLLRKV